MTTRTPEKSLEKNNELQKPRSFLHKAALAVTIAAGSMRAHVADCLAGQPRRQKSAVQQVVDRITPIVTPWTANETATAPGLAGELALPNGTTVNDIASGHGLIAVAHDSGDVTMHDETTGELLTTILGNGRHVSQLAMHPHRLELALVGRGDLRIVDIVSGEMIDRVTLSDTPMDVEIDATGNYVLIPVRGKPVQLYDMNTGAIKSLKQLGVTQDADFDPLTDSIAAMSGNIVKIYDGSTNKIVRQLKGLPGTVTCLDWDPTGKYIAAGDALGNVAIWNVAKGTLLYCEPAKALLPEGGIASISFSANGNKLVAVRGGGAGVILDAHEAINGTDDPTITTFGVWTNSELAPSQEKEMMYVKSRDLSMRSFVQAIVLEAAPAPIPAPQPQPAPAPVEPEPVPQPPVTEPPVTEPEPTPAPEPEPVPPPPVVEPAPPAPLPPEPVAPLPPEPEIITPQIIDTTQSAAAQAAAAAEIARMFDEAQEDANDIGHFKSFLTIEHQGYERTLFTVRFRNPGQQTFIEVMADNTDGSFTRKTILLEHPEGQPDGTWSFTLERRGSGWEGKVEIKLWDSQGRTQLLDQIDAAYKWGENQARILKEQTPWEHEEAGRNAESPITPDLRIAEVSGPNVLFTVASPSDQSYVMFKGDGLLMNQRLTHTGGTLLMPGSVTFNSALPTGHYSLELHEQFGGMRTDSVMFYWNKDAKQLSLVNTADGFVSETGTLSPQEIEEFNLIINIRSASFDNAQINWIQQMDFYHKTDKLSGPYDLYIDPLQELPARVRAAFPNFSSLSAYEQSATINDYHSALAKYEQAIGELLQKAVDILIQVRRGGDQQRLINDTLLPIYQKWLNPQHRTDWMPYSRAIEKIGHLGISLPSVSVLMESAKGVFDIGWGDVLERQEDMNATYDRMENIANLESNGLKLINGKWTVIDEKRYVASIIEAGGYATYTAQNNLPPELYALADTLYDGFTVIDQSEPWVRYEYVQSWYNSSQRIPGQSYYVNIQSEVGIIFAGLLQQADRIHLAYAQNASAREANLITMANYVQQLTDIPYKKILIAASASTEAERFSKMRALFETGNYGETFIPDSVSTPHMISAVNDMPSYTNGNIRIRFDINTGGKQISHLRFYLLADGRQIGGALTADVRGQSYVDIPVERIMEMFRFEGVPPTLNVQIKAVAWFTGENDSTVVSTKTDPFMVQWDGSSTNTGVNGSGNIKIMSHLMSNVLSGLVEQNGSYISPDRFKGGQCKTWVEKVVADATEGKVNLPSNLANNAVDGYAWILNDHPYVQQIAQVFKSSGDPEFFSRTILNGSVAVGDIVQMTGVFNENATLHTMIIGRIENNGIWVFDSNWGDQNIAVTDANGNITYRADETVRYHFFDFSRMNGDVNKFTIYRVQL